MAKYDYIIVGAGLYGATFAREATDAGKKALVIDRRPHIGGNVYTENIRGVCVHRYGAHIFHTGDRRVWEYACRFAEFNRFTNAPIALYKGNAYPLPFNMHTFHKMWGVTTPDEARAIIDQQRSDVNVDEPRNLEEQALSLVGRDIYERLIKGYTEKQWGRPCRELPAFIIRRLPVRLTYDNCYFDDPYQGVPIGGYTKMIARMLEGIEVRTSVDYLDDRKALSAIGERVVYTGSIDEYFGYRQGPLEYRSLRFETEALDTPNFQGCAVVNYTDADIPYTRIIEHKWLEFGKDERGADIPNTVISREYSAEWEPGAEPYYPIGNARNSALYGRYKELGNSESGVIFGGRLGEYRYYDMDQVIASALGAACRELGRQLR